MNNVLARAGIGFFAAFCVDLHGFVKTWTDTKAMPDFDYKLAFARWVVGAATGVLTALGGQGE